MSKVLPNLHALRVAAGLTIDELAKQANVSDYLIEQIEDGGACTGDEAQRLADALSATLVALGASDL
jgi:transcriptional regulator with XRE-family HTH domain